MTKARRKIYLKAKQKLSLEFLLSSTNDMIDNIEHWLDTGEIATEEKSKELYENLKIATREVELYFEEELAAEEEQK